MTTSEEKKREMEKTYRLIKDTAEENRKEEGFKEFTIEDLKTFIASNVFDNTRDMIKKDSEITLGAAMHFPPPRK